MPLSSGTRLGPYEVLSAIGAGGMGEVYRARDTKLNRDVALKILPAEFAADPDRLARFKREAQVLASVNHPNIGAIFGFEDGDGVHALVLELVEGPTLADRIAQGPMPLDDALPIAKQIAEALEAAHEHGIIHRDLKPANIKVRPDGAVKVLDFGLAKALEPVTSVAAGVTNSPTITTPAMMTGVGMILGTAAYMAPEQAKGRPADKRSDIWAFGCVLYEMLAGRRVFDGEDVADTLAFVLTKPVDFGPVSAVPPSVQRLLRRCLERDRRRRLADASDARLEIEEATSFPTGEAAAPRVVDRPSWPRQLVASLLALVAGGLVVGAGMWLARPIASSPAVTRFTIPLPEGQRFTENGLQVVAISRDGSRVVYVANRRLYLRSLSDLESRPIPGTEVAVGQSNNPVFSPDGNSIAYVAGRPPSIKRIAITGGAPLTICAACNPSGFMNWDRSGVAFAQVGFLPGSSVGTRLERVAVDGGEPQLLVKVPDGLPRNVEILPDGNAVLFSLVPGLGAAVEELNRAGGPSFDKAQVVVQSLQSGQRRVLIDGATSAHYVPTGHIVYAREGIVFARRFDVNTLKVSGDEVPIVEGVKRPIFLGGNPVGTSYFDISATGTLVYVPGPATATMQTDLALLDLKAGMTPLRLPPRSYEFPRVSPDGKWVAVGVTEGPVANIWIYDLSGASSIRQLTFGGKNRFPIWSSNGQYVAFQSDREGDLAIFRQRADGTGAAERLTKAEMGAMHIPDAWPDASRLLFEELKDGRYRLQTLTVPDGKIAAVGDIRGRIYLNAALSPDMRWIAYRSNSDGASALSVEPFPPTGSKYLIGNGIYPVWSRDGHDLIFRQLTTGEIMVTHVSTQSGFSFTNPEILSSGFAERASNASVRNHDMLPDGRFIGIVSAGAAGAATPDRINVVLNWFEELKQKVPAK